MSKATEDAGRFGSDLSEGLGASDGAREPWEAWKAMLDAIAGAEGSEPKASPLPGELDVWRRHWAAGKTPAQAWRAVPYKSGRFGA